MNVTIGENIRNKNKLILGFLCVLVELSSFEKVKFLIKVNDFNLNYRLSKKKKEKEKHEPSVFQALRPREFLESRKCCFYSLTLHD